MAQPRQPNQISAESYRIAPMFQQFAKERQYPETPSTSSNADGPKPMNLLYDHIL